MEFETLEEFAEKYPEEYADYEQDMADQLYDEYVDRMAGLANYGEVREYPEDFICISSQSA